MPAGDDICPQPAGEVGRINQACDTAVLHETPSVWSCLESGRWPGAGSDRGHGACPNIGLFTLPEWPGGDSEGLHLGRSWIGGDVRDTAISARSRDTWCRSLCFVGAQSCIPRVTGCIHYGRALSSTNSRGHAGPPVTPHDSSWQKSATLKQRGPPGAEGSTI